MSNRELNKLNFTKKNWSNLVTLNSIGNSNNETNFSQKLLLTNTQVFKIQKTFVNGSSVH